MRLSAKFPSLIVKLVILQELVMVGSAGSGVGAAFGYGEGPPLVFSIYLSLNICIL